VTGATGLRGPSGARGPTGTAGTGSSGGNQVTFIAVNNAVLAGQCISNGNLGNNVHAACPTPGIADTVYSEGPVPLGGGTITNLFAQMSTAPGVGNTQVVNVLDNGAVVLSCTVVNPATTCSAAGPVAVAAGHYLQVRIDAGAGTYTGQTWRVSFRY
jgi:hypothetical protein